MGILSWWGNKISSGKNDKKLEKSSVQTSAESENLAMHGAIELRRPNDVTVFEFGSASASADKVTLSGYCPVSDDLEPCRWEIFPSSGSDAPQFRVVF